jgi:hypothetical protein
MRLRAPASFLTVTLAGVAVLSGCFEDGSGITLPTTNTGVVGRIELDVPADSVRVAAIDSTGGEAVQARGEVETDGSYRVGDVPLRQTRLEVVAYSGGDVVGRALVHRETQRGDTVPVAPIGPETTVETRVLLSLLRSDSSAVAANHGGLTLFIRMDAAAAEAVLGSEDEVSALGMQFAAAEHHLRTAVPQVTSSLPNAARLDLLGEQAAIYSAARHGGAGLAAAHETFADSVLAGLTRSADARGVVLLTAMWARGGLRGSGVLIAEGRLALAKQLTEVNLIARQRLTTTVSETAPGESAAGTTEALADARDAVRSATSLTGIADALDAAAEAVEAAVIGGILAEAGGLGEVVEANVRQALGAAFEEADLGARLAPTGSAASAAQALFPYPDDVDAAANAVLDALPSAVVIDQGALAALLVAGRGGGPVP